MILGIIGLLLGFGTGYISQQNIINGLTLHTITQDQQLEGLEEEIQTLNNTLKSTIEKDTQLNADFNELTLEHEELSEDNNLLKGEKETLEELIEKLIEAIIADTPIERETPHFTFDNLSKTLHYTPFNLTELNIVDPKNSLSIAPNTLQ